MHVKKEEKKVFSIDIIIYLVSSFNFVPCTKML